ncbi:MAG: tetratricopeptide repeat protein [Thiobacillus sp.]|nr:tetratricopeptide repeat protein [Thiobacillus sp.]
MWKLPVALLLALFSQLALALPTPKDINAAVAARQYSQAEAMLHEVIQAKPQSAKAYYELGQVLLLEGRRGDARQALQEAQRLEPDLKFARSPEHFRELMNRVETTPATYAGGSAPMPSGKPFPWSYVLIGGGVLAILWLMLRRSAANAAPLVPAGYGAPSGAGGYQGYGSVPPAAPSPGIGGAVLGGLAGMAAGYGLAKVLDHEGSAQAAPVAAPAVFGSPSAAQPEAFDFGAGSGGDSWDAPDMGSGDGDW